MQCKSLHCAAITAVSTPYNRTGINYAFNACMVNTDTVETISQHFYQPDNNNIKNSHQETSLTIENKKHFTITFIFIARLLQFKCGPCYQ